MELQELGGTLGGEEKRRRRGGRREIIKTINYIPEVLSFPGTRSNYRWEGSKLERQRCNYKWERFKLLNKVSYRLDGFQGAFKHHSFYDNDFRICQSRLDGMLDFVNNGTTCLINRPLR